MPTEGVVKVPSGSERNGKMGIGGSNVKTPKTPPVPSHFGGSKGK